MDRESVHEIYQRQRAARQRKKRINALKRRIFFVLVFLILGFGIYTLYTANYFNIVEINCSGNNIISTEEILLKSEVNIGDNLFKSSVKRIGNNIASIPYVDEYTVWRSFPNKINIKVIETSPMAYISNHDNFWIVDKNGKLLENVEEYDSERNIPLITGIPADNYNVGDVLHESRNMLLSKALNCADIMDTLGLLSKTNEINIENDQDIKISYDNRLYIYIGAYDSFEYKMGVIKRILDNKDITEYEHAVLNYRTDRLYVGSEDMFAKSNDKPTNTEQPTEGSFENPKETGNPNSNNTN